MLRFHGALVLLVCLFVIGLEAAGAATPQRAAFKVGLTGTLTKDWTVSRTVAGECTEVTTHTGQWRMTLGTRRQSRIAFTSRGRGGRLGISPSLVRAIAGSARRGGSVLVTSRGPGCTRTIRIVRCALRRVDFRGATARLTTPRAGRARFTTLRGVSAARSFRGSCPDEPADVRALRTDLRLADAPLSAADAFGRNHVRWALTFTRVS